MIGLGADSHYTKPFELTDLESNIALEAWYKWNTGIGTTDVGLSAAGLFQFDVWRNSANTNTLLSSKLDLFPTPSASAILFADQSHALGPVIGVLDTTNDSFLETANAGDQLNLGEFTIFGVCDVVESGANNEAVIGRAGNDELRLFRATGADQARLRANGVNYDIDMTDNLPTGAFAWRLTRNGDTGAVLIHINGGAQGAVSTDINDTFDFKRIGNADTNLYMHELAIYNKGTLSAGDIALIEADMLLRIPQLSY